MYHESVQIDAEHVEKLLKRICFLVEIAKVNLKCMVILGQIGIQVHKLLNQRTHGFETVELVELEVKNKFRTFSHSKRAQQTAIANLLQ
jgi:hypothetical protein